jgi:hypothetical protein
MRTAFFNRFTIDLTLEQAMKGSHQGSCDLDVAELIKESTIHRQLDAISAEKIREELQEYGAWDDEELADEARNRERIVWLAAGNIRDEENELLTELNRALTT